MLLVEAKPLINNSKLSSYNLINNLFALGSLHFNFLCVMTTLASKEAGNPRPAISMKHFLASLGLVEYLAKHRFMESSNCSSSEYSPEAIDPVKRIQINERIEQM